MLGPLFYADAVGFQLSVVGSKGPRVRQLAALLLVATRTNGFAERSCIPMVLATDDWKLTESAVQYPGPNRTAFMNSSMEASA